MSERIQELIDLANGNLAMGHLLALSFACNDCDAELIQLNSTASLVILAKSECRLAFDGERWHLR